MNFKELCDQLYNDQEIPVCIDSRKIEPDCIFVAQKGVAFDSHSAIPEAVQAGAKYIVSEIETDIASNDCSVVIVEDSRKALAILAQIKYDYPASKLKTLAVTGTNGKTTTCYIVRSIINNSGHKCGLIGTIAYDCCSSEGIIEADMTTPDPLRLARLTAEMVENGAEYLVIEASSHALEQSRLAGFNFNGAAFTNITGDHLDYHKTMENYLSAKTILFESLGEKDFAILNADVCESEEIADKTKSYIYRYSLEGKGNINAKDIEASTSGSKYLLEFDGESVEINSCLPGKHNISNQLAAAGLCLSAGFSLEQIKAGIEALDCVPGRLESINEGQSFSVFVDYAHTDDALKNVLSTLKPICEERLICLFGCGGNRDKTKRPRMAEVAESFADIVIVTSDNPRTEDPDTIINDITDGFAEDFAGSANLYIEPDRKKAIKLAMSIAKQGDIVLLAGKGHETYQVVGEEKTHFDDKEAAIEFLRK